MAPSATTVLLPKVFPTDLVSIGQLVRNPLMPNVDTYLGGCAFVQPSDVSTPDPEAPYRAIISTDARHRVRRGPHVAVGDKLRRTENQPPLDRCGESAAAHPQGHGRCV